MCRNSSIDQDEPKPVKFKNILQEGVNSMVGDKGTSFILYRVQCLKTLILPLNRCMHCPFNIGPHPTAPNMIMQCKRPKGAELPKEICDKVDQDYPIEPEKKETKADV
jgi:hypothetical protein